MIFFSRKRSNKNHLRGDIFKRSFIRIENGVQMIEEMPQIVRIAPVIKVQEEPGKRKYELDASL